MKRTYVDILGEYYDNDDLYQSAGDLGVSAAVLKKVFQTKLSKRKPKFKKD